MERLIIGILTLFVVAIIGMGAVALGKKRDKQMHDSIRRQYDAQKDIWI